MKLILKNSSLLFQKYEPVGNLIDSATPVENKYLNNANSSSAAYVNSVDYTSFEMDVSGLAAGTQLYTKTSPQADVDSYGRCYAFFNGDTWVSGSNAYVTARGFAIPEGVTTLKMSFKSWVTGTDPHEPVTFFYVSTTPYSGT